jgi:hypothetical protein
MRPGVTTMQASSRRKSLVERAEHDGEGEVECPMEAADRIGKCTRMLGYGCSNPRMRQLQQQRTAGSQEDGCLAIHPPSRRGGSKDAGYRIGRGRLDKLEMVLKVR